METKQIMSASAHTFERLRHCENEVEFWLASELGPFLGYAAWQELPIARAMKACKKSGQHSDGHFERIACMVPPKKGTKGQIEDIRLSRYACYLLVQNGDPSKPGIAKGQAYLALQTRRQELASSSMGVTERSALFFCATQAEETDRAYHEVARKVDQTIAELGGSVPKGLSPRGIGEQE